MLTRRKYWMLVAVFTACALVFVAAFFLVPATTVGPLGKWRYLIMAVMNLGLVCMLVFKAPPPHPPTDS